MAVRETLTLSIDSQIGFAAYYSLIEDVDRGTNYAIKYDYDVSGNWEFPGCLLDYYLDTRQNIAFSRAQMSGAIDGESESIFSHH